MVRPLNAAEVRAKAFLEIASALYETSLTNIGAQLRLSLTGRTYDVSFATGGLRLLRQVAQGKVGVGWINPTGALAMAVRGKGLFQEPLPLRALAQFPSWDRLAFAVAEDTGITSLADLREKRYPLRVSTRFLSRDDPTMFAVGEVLKAYGFSFAHIRRWGGKIHSVPNPRHPDRLGAITSQSVDAVFDEGIKSWGPQALEAGMRFLPLDEEVLAYMESLGFRRGPIPRSVYPGLKEDVMAVDFSGWPMYVHAEMPEELVYALCEAIDLRKGAIPIDRSISLEERMLGTMSWLCTDGEETPLDVPFHPGAERYFREKGYLH